MSHKIVATTESVRAAFSWEDKYPHEGSHNPEWAAEFDRWLQRELGMAWNQGKVAGVLQLSAPPGSINQIDVDNPYT